MSDIYKDIDIRDRREEKAEFPDQVEEEKQVQTQIPSIKDKRGTYIDFFQSHEYADDFGTTNGLFSLYDPDNPDRQLMDIVEQEAISLSSPPMKYWKLKKSLSNIDPIYGEVTRRDAFEDAVTIFGNYEDPSPIQELTKYGLNQAETLDIWFNFNHLLNTIGDKIQIGDIIQTYDGKFWEVMTSLIIDESLWRPQHNNVKVIKTPSEGIYLPGFGGLEQTPTVSDE